MIQEELDRLAAALNSGEAEDKITAIRLLRDVGDETAISALVSALNDRDVGVQREVVEALVYRNDSRADGYLVAALRDADDLLRAWAVRMIGKSAKSVWIGELKRALNDKAPHVRLAAAEALGWIRDPKATSILTRGISDEDRAIRLAVVNALAWAGYENSVSGLKRAAFDDDVEIRRSAVKALDDLKTAKKIGVLRKVLHDEDRLVRRFAAGALGSWSERTEVRKSLLAALDDKDEGVREQAVLSLRWRQHEDVANGLLRLTHDESRKVRLAVLEALGSNWKDRRVVKTLMGCAMDPDQDVRRKAIGILSYCDGDSIEPVLMECTRDTEAKIRRSAVSALGRKDGSKVLKSLIDAANDDELGVRIAAIESLSNFDDNKARQILEAALKNRHVEIRRTAACALDRDYHKNSESVMLETLEKEPDSLTRTWLVRSLGSLKYKRAVDTLSRILRDPEEECEIRTWAASSLGKIQGKAAVAALVTALSDDNILIQEAAVKALDRVDEGEVQKRLEKSVDAKELDPVSLIKIEIENQVRSGLSIKDYDDLYFDRDNSFRCRIRREFYEILIQSQPGDRFVCGVTVQNGYHVLKKPIKLTCAKAILKEYIKADSIKVGELMTENRLLALCHHPESEQITEDDLETFFSLHVERSFWRFYILALIENGNLKISCPFRQAGAWVLKNVPFAIW